MAHTIRLSIHRRTASAVWRSVSPSMIERVAERVGSTVMICDAAGEEAAPEAKLHVGALSERRAACAGARVLGSARGVGSKGRL